MSNPNLSLSDYVFSPIPSVTLTLPSGDTAFSYESTIIHNPTRTQSSDSDQNEESLDDILDTQCKMKKNA
eukprot:3562351-Ditylum_brightwellii.AAC.1